MYNIFESFFRTVVLFLNYRNSQRGVHHQRQYSTPERSVQSPLNISNFHLSPAGSLSKAFSNEMLEWFDGEGNQAPTSVWQVRMENLQITIFKRKGTQLLICCIFNWSEVRHSLQLANEVSCNLQKIKEYSLKFMKIDWS